MDFVSKAFGSLNMGLPFTLGAQVEGISDQPWKLFDATLKKDSSDISVFEYDERNEAQAQNATTALRKLKLPGVIKHIETVVSGKRTYIITERVKLFNFQSLDTEAKKFVLNETLQALSTLYTVANCKHNSVCSNTVMQSVTTGKPLLVGFDLATANNLPVPPTASFFTTLPFPANEGWSSPTLDTYQFGLLVAELLPQETRLITSLKAAKRPSLVKLASSNSAAIVFNNPISELVSEIGQAVLLSPHDLSKLCEQITSIVPSLYPEMIRGTFLPELLRTESTNVLGTNLLLIAHLSKNSSLVLTDSDPIIKYLVAQYQSLDRMVRLELLRFLPQYVTLIPDRVVQQSIMPKMVFGFGDNEVIVRKASVAAVEFLANKLSTRQLNSELLRLLAKTHTDVDADVRALTTSVLCRLAPKIQSRSVISSALSRALKDPVPKCRNAALRGVSQIDVPAREIAEKLLGPAASGMLDKDVEVSAEAWRVTEELLKKIRAEATSKSPAHEPSPLHSEVIPETPTPSVLPRQPAQSQSQSQPQSQSHIQMQPKRPLQPPTSVPTPLSTLHNATVKQDDDIHTEPDTWGWDADDDQHSTDENETAKAEVEDAWGWDDKEESEVDEDAWGW